MEKHICCICGKEFEGPGNNPYPIVEDPRKRCCDNCNVKEVIPARIIQLYIDKELGLIKEN